MLCYKRRIPIPELEARIEVSGSLVVTSKLGPEEMGFLMFLRRFLTEKTVQLMVASSLGLAKLSSRALSTFPAGIVNKDISLPLLGY